MTNLLDLYRTQVRILWEWRGGPWALLKRLVITLLVATVAFWPRPGSCRASQSPASLDAVDRRDPDGAVQRHHPAGAPGARRAALADPAPGSPSSSCRSSSFLVVAPLAPGVEVDGSCRR